jgi:hypothetical protein
MGNARIKDLVEGTLQVLDNVVVDIASIGTRRFTIQKLRKALGPVGHVLGGSRGRFRHEEDFAHLDGAQSGQMLTFVSGTGAVAIAAADTSPANTEGFGWLDLTVGGAAGTAFAADGVNIVRGGMKPIYEARCKMPAVFADATTTQGLEDGGGGSYARLATNTSGQWLAES